jgi:8-oxo-dGTP diphosphatase
VKSNRLAAGGVVERAFPDGLRIAVVHRTRYADHQGGDGDWVLPKGKPDKGESLEQTALREVREEAGCTARIVGPGIRSEYLVRGMPKVVTFFRMECVSHGSTIDASEVRDVAWLTLRDALARLTYDTERAVVRQAYPELNEVET